MGGLLLKQLVKALITTGGGSGAGPGGTMARQGCIITASRPGFPKGG